MQTSSDNIQLFQEPLEALDQACFDYRASIFGMLNPNDDRKKQYRTAEAEYKKAIKNAIKYLRSELKSIEESSWSTLATTENE